jgi:hypothetical protein
VCLLFQRLWLAHLTATCVSCGSRACGKQVGPELLLRAFNDSREQDSTLLDIVTKCDRDFSLCFVSLVALLGRTTNLPITTVASSASSLPRPHRVYYQRRAVVFESSAWCPRRRNDSLKSRTVHSFCAGRCVRRGSGTWLRIPFVHRYKDRAASAVRANTGPMNP